MGEGLFREDAQIRRIVREAAVLGGAGYALVLQLAHPKVAQGVHDHSDFATRPLHRLLGTLTFVYGVLFGTRQEAERISRTVRAGHTRISGPGHHALDPDLQVWVAATLCESAVRLYELTVGELSPQDRDEKYAQSAVLATALGCPAERWPAGRVEFEAYWAATVASIQVSDAARELAVRLFVPANPLLRPAARLQRFIATGLLPPRLRDGLGLTWGPRHQRRFDRMFAVIRALYPRLPLALRTAPRDLCLWDIRRRAARTRLHHRPRPRLPRH